MNKLAISGLVFLTTIGICFMSFMTVKNATEKSCQMVENIEDSLGDPLKLEESFEQFNGYWDTKTKTLGMILHHQHLDEINQDVSKLRVAIKNNSEFEIEESCESIKSRIKSTSETDNISLENIF